MARRNPAEQAVREAAEEIQRETRAAAAEVRFELGAAGRETQEALREAMQEIRASFAEALGATDERSRESADQPSRLSRAQRKEMTRELLLDAAIEVFAEKGYHGASLDDVAEAAGFTKGAVYSNFTRKADLFRALLERETSRRNAALGQGIELVPFELLPVLAGEWLARQAEEERDWGILTVEFWLAAARDPALSETLCDGQGEAMEHFGKLIDRKLEAAGVDAGLSGRELAIVVNALGTGLLMDRYAGGDADHGEIFSKAIRKLLGTAAPDRHRTEAADHKEAGETP